MKSISELTEDEKSLMLAELMWWTIDDKGFISKGAGRQNNGWSLGPYTNTASGLAQSCAILLNFLRLCVALIASALTETAQAA